jgi:hypothetical protein
MEQLPYIGEHDQRVGAPADVVWTALLKILRREMGGSAPIARTWAATPPRARPSLPAGPGKAVPGFRVVEAEPGRRLALRGRHRFSSYALTFVLDRRMPRMRRHLRRKPHARRLHPTGARTHASHADGHCFAAHRARHPGRELRFRGGSVAR